MNRQYIPILFIISVLIACVIVLLDKNHRSLESEKTLKADIKLRQDSIRMYRDREAIQSKHVQFWQTAYNSAKDSLEVERKNVKIKFVEYKVPIKIDLSTDNKRDSVIEQIIK